MLMFRECCRTATRERENLFKKRFAGESAYATQ